MNKIGVIEGFFGPAWPLQARLGYADFLARSGGGFYIYAPKQDPYLRKRWREEWPTSWCDQLTRMAQHFTDRQVTFGVGLSPFGLGTTLSPSDKMLLTSKLEILQKSGVGLLGLFFDDMPTDDDLAPAQMACVDWVRKNFSGKIVFCPSYYSFDPILEKVFGKMPDGYWQTIAQLTPPEVSMAWTGPKVISPEVPSAHLQEVTELLKRRPFMWENLFANDGPKNCKFLKLQAFTGRSTGVLDQVEAYGFNMMNQPYLSQIVFLASCLVLEEKSDPETAFQTALSQLCPGGLRTFINRHRDNFLRVGLDQLTEKDQLIAELSSFAHPVAAEITDWLSGKYVVGSECLTD
jgi:hyaluronoglucosaminidase